MHDAGKIIAGLVVFLALVTSPMWYQAARGAEPGPPKLEIDEAVRDGDRIYVGVGGKEYEKSLTGTCLSCHSSKEAFCNRCHDYVGAEPYCWDCHGESGEIH
jgi:cytochrome c553